MNKRVFTIIMLFILASNAIYSQRSAKEFSDLQQKEQQKTSIENDTIQSITKMPEFPGGTAGLYKYLGRKLKYPKSAKEEGLKGTVYVSFMINKKGEVSDVVVTKGLSEDIDNEAIRVINSMPKWTPAEQYDKKIDVMYRLPIFFKP